MPRKASKQSVETIKAVGSAFYCSAETVAQTLRDFGVATLLTQDKKNKWLLFKINNEDERCMRMGDVFMVDVPGISKKYETRNKKKVKKQEESETDEVRSV